MPGTGRKPLGVCAVVMSLGLVWTADAAATEYDPPWVGREHLKPKSPTAPPWVDDDTVKLRSPYYPPWVHCPEHATGLARGGVWAYPVNWRDVDWSQGGWGAGVHQRTQAFSLAVEAKCCSKDEGPADCKRPRPILEFFRDPPMTGPGRPKDN